MSSHADLWLEAQFKRCKRLMPENEPISVKVGPYWSRNQKTQFLAVDFVSGEYSASLTFAVIKKCNYAVDEDVEVGSLAEAFNLAGRLINRLGAVSVPNSMELKGYAQI